MADFDEAMDASYEIWDGFAAMVAKAMAERLDRGSQPYQCPGNLQAAWLFVECIVPLSDNSHLLGNELLANAADDLATQLEGASWTASYEEAFGETRRDFIAKLRDWLVKVEAQEKEDAEAEAISKKAVEEYRKQHRQD